MTPASLEPGEVLAERYRVDGLLGAGGFGTVLIATDQVIGRQVALKLLSTEHLGSAETRDRFLREARVLGLLHGEHGAQIYDVGSLPDGRPFISMELLRGNDLSKELRRRGALPIGEAAQTVIEVCRGLRAAHANGIVHRDLKPQNIFWAVRADGSRQTKVLDFGIARIPSNDPLTASGAWVGTPRYMSPEQLTDPGGVDLRADIWALGVVLYELLTAKPIFDAATPAVYASKVLTDRPVPLCVRNPTLPAALEAVVDRCLQQRPEERFASVDQLAEALQPYAEAHAPESSQTTELDIPTRGSGPSVTTTATGGIVAPQATPGPVNIPPRPVPRSPSPRTTLVLSALLVAAAVWIGVTQVFSRAELPPSGSAHEPSASASATVVAFSPPASTTAAASVASAVPSVSAALTASAAASASATPTFTLPSSKPAAPAPSADADRQAAIVQACQHNADEAPRFLVVGNDGPSIMQCERLANLGCAGIKRGCRSVTDPSQLLRCSRFLGLLARDGTCR